MRLLKSGVRMSRKLYPAIHGNGSIFEIESHPHKVIKIHEMGVFISKDYFVSMISEFSNRKESRFFSYAKVAVYIHEDLEMKDEEFNKQYANWCMTYAERVNSEGFDYSTLSNMKTMKVKV